MTAEQWATYREILRSHDAGQTKQTERQLRELTRESPDFVEAHRSYQDLLLAEGRLDELVAEYDAGVARAGEDGIALSLRARLEDDPRKRLALLRTAEGLSPGVAWILVARAHARASLGDLKKALGDLEEATRLDPRLPEAWLDYGDLSEAFDRKQAISAYARYLELRPDEAAISIRLGWLLLQEGRIREAEEVFRRLRTHSPTFADAAWGLALVAEAEGRFDDCQRWVEEGVTLAPDDPVHEYNLGVCLSRPGVARPDLAVEALRRYLEKGGERTIRIQNWIERIQAEEVKR